jgi:hypothetical protein
MFDSVASLVTLALVLILLIGLFLAGRKIVWWYFGIDRALRALESIDASLRQLPAVREFDHISGRRAAKVA